MSFLKKTRPSRLASCFDKAWVQRKLPFATPIQTEGQTIEAHALDPEHSELHRSRQSGSHLRSAGRRSPRRPVGWEKTPVEIEDLRGTNADHNESQSRPEPGQVRARPAVRVGSFTQCDARVPQAFSTTYNSVSIGRIIGRTLLRRKSDRATISFERCTR